MFSAEHSWVPGSRSSESKRLFGELGALMNEISRAVEAELKPFGLTYAQFQVLLHVQLRPGLLQRELGQRLSVTAGNVSMLVTRLERTGLLARTPDGAAFHLELTSEGVALFERLRPVREAFVTDRFSGLSVAEISAAADALHKARRR